MQWNMKKFAKLKFTDFIDTKNRKSDKAMVDVVSAIKDEVKPHGDTWLPADGIYSDSSGPYRSFELMFNLSVSVIVSLEYLSAVNWFPVYAIVAVANSIGSHPLISVWSALSDDT